MESLMAGKLINPDGLRADLAFVLMACKIPDLYVAESFTGRPITKTFVIPAAKPESRKMNRINFILDPGQACPGLDPGFRFAPLPGMTSYWTGCEAFHIPMIV